MRITIETTLTKHEYQLDQIEDDIKMTKITGDTAYKDRLKTQKEMVTDFIMELKRIEK